MDGARAPHAGLCAACAHARVVASARGSTFLRCGLSDSDARFPRYPRLPVTKCAGYAAPEDTRTQYPPSE